MDKKLQIVQHLYDEASDPAALRPLLEDEALLAEHQAMSEAKFLLDHQTSQKPPQHVLDAVLAAAASPETIPDAAPDRPARPRLRLVRTPWMRAAAVVTILVLVGIWYLPPGATPDAEMALMKEEASSVDAAQNEVQPVDKSLLADSERSEPAAEGESAPIGESLASFSADDAVNEQEFEADFDARVDAAARLRAPAAPSAGLTLASASTDSLTPSWNDAEEILRYQRRIQMLLEQTEGLDWDEPAVPLEMLPGQVRTQPGIHQAGSRANSSRNQ